MSVTTKYMFTFGSFDIQPELETMLKRENRCVVVIGAPGGCSTSLENCLYNGGSLSRRTQCANQVSTSLLLLATQMEEPIYHKLPTDLWPIVGDFIFMTISPEETGSLILTVKPSTGYAIIYPREEPGEGFVVPCVIC